MKSPRMNSIGRFPKSEIQFEPGDLLLFYGRDLTSRMIELATRGPSHIGIVLPIYSRGLLLVESTTLCDQPRQSGTQNGWHYCLD
jgi:hypothetical protein